MVEGVESVGGSKDMRINQLHNIYAGKNIQQLRRIRSNVLKTQFRESLTDKVEISATAKQLSKVNESPELRKERVREIKRLLEAQQLLTQEKIRIGVKRMLLLSIL